MECGCKTGTEVRGDNGTGDGVGREQADPVGGVDGQADDLNGEPRVVVGDERILEEADSSRNASRNSRGQSCHGGRGHLEDPEVDEVPGRKGICSEAFLAQFYLAVASSTLGSARPCMPA